MATRTPLKTIRAKCLDCCCDSSYEVRLCPSDDCPLHPYRLGKTGKTRKMSEEHKEKVRAGLQKARSSKKTLTTTGVEDVTAPQRGGGA